MSTYSALEDAIVARLNIAGVVVRAQPENEVEASDKVLGPRITISYQHSEFSASIPRGLPELFSTNEALQDEFIEIHFVLQSRLLRGTNGIYDLIDKCHKKILGWKTGKFDRFFCKTCDYLENVDGLWIWDLVYVAKAPFVQEFTDDHGESQPILNQVDFNTTIS